MQYSCASLQVNASSEFCGIEQEVKGESGTSVCNAVMTEKMSSELQRERRKNAELMEKIFLLETQLQQRDDQLGRSNVQDSSPNGRERRFEKFKRQKAEISTRKLEESNIEMPAEAQCKPSRDMIHENRPVKWMSIDDYQLFECEKLQYGDPSADCDDHTDDSDDEMNKDVDGNGLHGDGKDIGYVHSSSEHEEFLDCDAKGAYLPCMENSFIGHGEPTASTKSIGRGSLLNDISHAYAEGAFEKHDKCEDFISRQESRQCANGNMSLQKKSPKVAFCPKEVRRIIELDELLLRNAQSHTIRKIIVFASLGIKHGSEDVYELDFNHFRLLHKGEPYLSSLSPGEHVVYDNPGIRKKVFYPNRQNPTLCPVQILEEEEVMRPSYAGCPSSLFLCIKYGGSTRNLPQNEYVRQRMGRKKLKSFGPLICRMAMLAHIRRGSFFFKALGITLLFMAGFRGDLVSKETKYRNLDLLQKYYRTDEDAEGEELFLLNPTTFETLAADSQRLTGKGCQTKSRGKKRRTSITKSAQELATIPESALSTSSPPTHFRIMGYTSIQAHAMPSQTPINSPSILNPRIPNPNQSSYLNYSFQPHLANSFVPIMYWPPPNASFHPGYPYSYNYRHFPSMGNYFPINTQPPHSHASSTPFIPKIEEGIVQNDAVLEKTDSDSISSSRCTKRKEK